jgi:ribonucleoside-diphosphate reductase alpha subunit
LQTMGIHTNVIVYSLYIDYTEVQKLLELGFEPKIYKLPKKSINAPSYTTIVSVEDTNRLDDTYCFTETKRGMGIFEGVLIGQCAEIVEYSDNKKYACCCLGSIILQNCIIFDKEDHTTDIDEPERYHNKKESSLEKKKRDKQEKPETESHATTIKVPKLTTMRNSFDFNMLYKVVRTMTRNLDNAMDINFYPVPETRESNMSERPIGIGVQGLGDTFFALGLPYDSPEAKELNRNIFETIYFAAVSESIELAKEKGSYKTYEGSPASKGQLQFDLWSDKKDSGFVKPTDERHDWTGLKKELAKYGLRNSMLTACMPTASTAHIAGTLAEAFEPISYNMYTRAVGAGNYTVVNSYFIKDISKLSKFTTIINSLKKHRGSVQNIRDVPEHLKRLYKTAYEISQKVLIDLSADRGPFIDQSQSLNLFFRSNDDKMISKMTMAHFHGFKRGLKTGSYYIRSESSVNADAMIMDSAPTVSVSTKPEDDCDMCGA